jgi:O-antigen ligase
MGSRMRAGVVRSLGPRRRSRLWGPEHPFRDDACLFLFGAAGAYSVNLVGALPWGEILALLLLPMLLLSRGKRPFDRQYLWFYLLTLGWFLGTLIADEANGIGAFNRAKGTARVVFFLIDFIALAVLINNETRKFIVFALSIAAVMLFSAKQFVGDTLTAFKFGGSSVIILLSLLGASHFYAKKRYRIAIGISFALMLLNLNFAFRSQVAIILVSAVLTLPLFTNYGKGYGRGNPTGHNIVRVSALIIFALGSAYLANQLVKYAASRGFYEESTQEKFEQQSNGKLGVLFGGRPETLVAIQAIRDRPIVGHGSFAADIHYLELQQQLQYEYGYSDSDATGDVDFYPVIPTHSHLTMAWVESGILGGVLWIYILVLTSRAIFRVAVTRPNMAPLYSYLLVNFVWDILYSPFGSVNRMVGAYLVLLGYHMLRMPVRGPQAAGARKPALLHARPIGRKRHFVPGLADGLRR